MYGANKMSLIIEDYKDFFPDVSGKQVRPSKLPNVTVRKALLQRESVDTEHVFDWYDAMRPRSEVVGANASAGVDVPKTRTPKRRMTDALRPLSRSSPSPRPLA